MIVQKILFLTSLRAANIIDELLENYDKRFAPANEGENHTFKSD